MRNEKLKDILDDAVSGIGEDPRLLGKVLSRAENGEDVQMTKKVSTGTLLIAAVIILLMSAGIAAVSGWGVLDFLKNEEKNTEVTATPIGKEAETEHARLRVDSAVYDGGVLAFDWTVENKDPEVPMWCWLEKFDINGRAHESEIVNDGYYSHFEDNQWLPGEMYPDGIAQSGEFVPLPYGIAGEETIRVELTLKVYRPNRPVALVNTDGAYGKEVEQKMAEGYFPIPSFSWGDGVQWPDGFFMAEEDPAACPEGWSIAVSGDPVLDDRMGGMTEEVLEIRFDVAKQTQGRGKETVKLQAQEKYENEYCTATYVQADVSPLGLYLTLRVKPKNDQCTPRNNCRLTDGDGNALEGIRFYPTSHVHNPSFEYPGEMVWMYEWSMVRPEDLPDTISLSCRLENGEDMIFPVKVR